MKTFKGVKALVVLAALVLGIALGYQQILPAASLPPGFVEQPKSLQEALPGPDLNLMLSHIREMAREAHPVDSPALHRAQGYLKDQLTRMGYAYTEEHHALTIQDILDLEQERVAAGRVPFHMTEESIRNNADMGDKPTMNLTNIVVHLDAPDTEDTILFMAHTDSVKTGPGAFDDTVSVAAMLEALRLLQGITPVRDLVFLFTDGEEQGLLGAANFVASHPEMKDRTQLVVNLEARGNRGALLMFETTENNLAMVRAYRQAAGAPFSMSIATAIYRTMKNDTDLTRFMMAGYPGMNLAVLQGAEVYHTSRDHYDTFDRLSAASYLDTVTGMAGYFATQLDLELTSNQNGVFFPFFQGRLVVLPESLANGLAYAALGLYLLVLLIALVRGRVRLGRVLLAALTQVALMALAFGLGLLAIKSVQLLFRQADYRSALGFTAGGPIFLVLLALFGLISALAYRLLMKKQGEHKSAALGVLLVPAVLAALTALYFPAATYLFSISVLAGLGVFALGRFCLLGFLPGAAAFATLLLFTPLVALVYIALSFASAHLALALALLPLTMLLPEVLAAWGLKKPA